MFFVACNGKKTHEKKLKKLPQQRFLINMEHYFSDAEFEASFPVWFDDSVVRQHRIKRITRRALPSKANENSLPKEIKEYEFDESGELVKMRVSQYYENMIVGDVTFNYVDIKDEMGYALVEIDDEKSLVEESGLYNYKLYKKEKYTEKYLVYLNETTGNYLFYMLNEKNWGSLSVDSILQPTPEDIIVFGNPLHPIKKYQVYNTVNESNVVNMEYMKNGDRILNISFEKYPFYTKRYITYDKNGYCAGYVDSTFSVERYLTRKVSSFSSDKNHLPLVLTHKKGQEGTEQFEKFEYAYYDE
ncbi:MAG: hypothetical protein JKY09_02030 [Crocinitomicaceae bacterium]|nr:hypothetical protein [Crocinitomicaceae bacterium]